MPRRKSNLGPRTRRARAKRRAVANQTVEEKASALKRRRRQLAKLRAKETPEQREARLEEARIRARQYRAAAAAQLRTRQRKLERLERQRLAEQLAQEKAAQLQTRLRSRQSRPPMRWVVKEGENGSEVVLSESEWRPPPLRPSFSGKDGRVSVKKEEMSDAPVDNAQHGHEEGKAGKRKGAGRRGQAKKHVL
ncbi:UBX domain-containing protein 1-like [Anolis sagrei]|uniref:UBX domain-containing protein 1-like n=1 Tax=Anolis sagrei TaxID=38937 RepID=UPI00352198D0